MSVIVIHAHGKAQSNGSKEPQTMFNRNIKFWERTGEKIVVVSPEDSRVSTRHDQVHFGKSEHLGQYALGRILEVLRVIVDYDGGIHAEGDSVFLGDDIDWQPGFRCQACPNYDQRFIAPLYPPIPAMIDKPSALALLDAAKAHPEITEEFYTDRWLGALAYKIGMRFEPLAGGTWVCNTILDSDLPRLAEAVDGGMLWIHGVKSKAAHDCILKHWKKNPWK